MQRPIAWTCKYIEVEGPQGASATYVSLQFTRMYEQIRGASATARDEELYSLGRVGLYSTNSPRFSITGAGRYLLYLPGTVRQCDNDPVLLPKSAFGDILNALNGYNDKLIAEMECRMDVAKPGTDRSVISVRQFPSGYVKPFDWDISEHGYLSFKNVRGDIRGKGVLCVCGNQWHICSEYGPDIHPSILRLCVPGTNLAADTEVVYLDPTLRDAVRMALNAYMVTESARYYSQMADMDVPSHMLSAAEVRRQWGIPDAEDTDKTTSTNNAEEETNMLTFDKQVIITALKNIKDQISHKAAEESNWNALGMAVALWLESDEPTRTIDVGYVLEDIRGIVAEYTRVINGLTLCVDNNLTDKDINASLKCDIQAMLNADGILNNLPKQSIVVTRK